MGTITSKNAAEVAERHGLPEVHLMTYLEKEIAAGESCQSLPFTLLLVVSYALMVLNHGEAPWVAAVEDSLRFDILDNANFAFTRYPIGHKDMDDVNSHADFWSWFSRGLVPLLWRQEYTVSEIALEQQSPEQLSQVQVPLEHNMRGVWLEYNRIVLGVRLSQEVDDTTSECEHHSGLESFYNRGCTGGTGYELEPELFDARITTNPTRVEMLYIHDDQEDIQTRVYELERDYWLDERTKKVEIAIPVYNGEYGLHCMLYVNFFFSRGGRIWKAIIPMSAFEYWFASPWSWVFDSTWLMCIMWIIVTETIEITGVLRRYGIPGLWEHYWGFWNGMDWFSAVTGVALAAGFLGNLANVNEMNKLLEELGSLDEQTQQAAYRAKGQEYMEALEVEVQYMYWYRMCLAAYPFVIVIRLFKAFSAQPRLAIVTRTLVHSSIDLAHFLIICSSVFIMYAIAAVVLFGRDNPDFTTTSRSLTSCFRAMLGDFEWEELKEVGRLDASFWFIPFNLLISIILLNMLIAMVMDAYSDVVEQIGQTDTLWREGVKAYKRWRLYMKGEAANMGAILAAVKKELADRRKGHVDDRELEVDDVKAKTISRGSMTPKKSMANEDKAAARAKLKAKRWIITVQNLKQIIQKELGEKKQSFSIAQARQILADAMALYSQDHREKPDVEDVVSSFRKISWRADKLKKINDQAMHSQSLARNRTGEVMECVQEATDEITQALEDLAGWSYEDDEDQPIPAGVMKEIEKVKNTKVCECGNIFMDDSIFCRKCGRRRDKDNGRPGDSLEARKPDLMGGVRNMVGGSGVRRPELVEGTWHQLLTDESAVINACREAGLDAGVNLMRRTAVGKMVKVLERDDRQGIVRCHLPNAGEIWFAFAAFGIKIKDEVAESTTVSDRSALTDAERIQELEQELLVGRETVAEALQAVTDLHGRLQRTRAEKRSAMDKFSQLRQKAMLLSKENRAQREQFQQGQVNLKVLTTQRDEHFERVKALMEENREVKMAIEEAKARKSTNGNGR